MSPCALQTRSLILSTIQQLEGRLARLFPKTHPLTRHTAVHEMLFLLLRLLFSISKLPGSPALPDVANFLGLSLTSAAIYSIPRNRIHLAP